MVDYSEIGKGGIVKEGIFERFPQLVPSSLPQNWGNSQSHNKLMIVMESNYFEDNVDSVFKDPEAWYMGDDTSHLIPKDCEYLVKNDKAGYRPFDRLRDSMKAVLKTEIGTIYEEALFYNYFLRPATVKGTNRSFKKDCTQLDRDVAGTALCGVLDILKPDIVIFASKFAYDEFLKYKKSVGFDCKIDFVYHPSARFKYKWDLNPNSQQKFEKLLRDYWVK